jgi:peroxiredoxin family protein
MAELGYKIREKHPDVFDSLKNTSHDAENDVYLCQSQLTVVDFDQLTKTINPNKQPSSFDALLIEENEKTVFCIEFKNQEASSIKNSQIQKKAEDSMNTLNRFCAENNVAINDYKLIACIVYNPTSNGYTYRRFKENIVHFGLDAYQDRLFDKVVTNGIDFFTKEFQRKYPPCLLSEANHP